MKKLLSWILVIALVLPTIGLTGYGIYLGTTAYEYAPSQHHSCGMPVLLDFETTEEMLEYLRTNPTFYPPTSLFDGDSWEAAFIPVVDTPIGYEMKACYPRLDGIVYSFRKIGPLALGEDGKMSGADDVNIAFYFSGDQSRFETYVLPDDDSAQQTISLIRGVPASVWYEDQGMEKSYSVRSGEMEIICTMGKDSFPAAGYLVGEALNFRRIPLEAVKQYGKDALNFPWATFFGEIHLFLFPLYAAIAFGVGWLIVPFAKRKKKKTPTK